jgi:hypothetical protein
MKSEIDSLNEFNTLKYHGKIERFVVLFVFMVKRDLRY